MNDLGDSGGRGGGLLEDMGHSGGWDCWRIWGVAWWTVLEDMGDSGVVGGGGLLEDLGDGRGKRWRRCR